MSCFGVLLDEKARRLPVFFNTNRQWLFQWPRRKSESEPQIRMYRHSRVTLPCAARPPEGQQGQQQQQAGAEEAPPAAPSTHVSSTEHPTMIASVARCRLLAAPLQRQLRPAARSLRSFAAVGAQQAAGLDADALDGGGCVLCRRRPRGWPTDWRPGSAVAVYQCVPPLATQGVPLAYWVVLPVGLAAWQRARVGRAACEA